MQGSSARSVFGTRPLLGFRRLTAANQTVSWARLADIQRDRGDTFKQLVYTLESLKGAQLKTYADDWRSLLAPLTYLVILTRWKPVLEQELGATRGQALLDGLSAWLLPVIVAGAKKADAESNSNSGSVSSAQGSDGAGVSLALVHVRSFDEELALALYSVGATLSQIIVVLSNRLDEVAVLKYSLKISNVVALIWSSLSAFRTIHATATAVETSGDASWIGGEPSPRLARTMPYNTHVLDAFYAHTCAQAAEMWVKFYLDRLTDAETGAYNFATLNKLIGMCYRCALDYAAVYDGLLEAVDKNENHADHMEVCAAGHLTHGRLRRTAAVKRYHYIALGCSYLLDAVAAYTLEDGTLDLASIPVDAMLPRTSEALSNCQRVMKEALEKMRQSLAKNKAAWEPARHREFEAMHKELADQLEQLATSALVSVADATTTDDTPQTLLESVLGRPETLSGIDVTSRGVAIEAQPDIWQLAESLCNDNILKSAFLLDPLATILPVGMRRTVSDWMPQLATYLRELGLDALVSTSPQGSLLDLPSTPIAIVRPAFSSGPQEATPLIPDDIATLFAKNLDIFTAFRRLGKLIKALKRIQAFARSSPRGQELNPICTKLLEQFTGLLSLTRTIFFDAAEPQIEPTLLVQFAAHLDGAEWLKLRELNLQQLATRLISSSLSIQHMRQLNESQLLVRSEVLRIYKALFSTEERR